MTETEHARLRLLLTLSATFMALGLLVACSQMGS